MEKTVSFPYNGRYPARSDLLCSDRGTSPVCSGFSWEGSYYPQVPPFHPGGNGSFTFARAAGWHHSPPGLFLSPYRVNLPFLWLFTLYLSQLLLICGFSFAYLKEDVQFIGALQLNTGWTIYMRKGMDFRSVDSYSKP